MVKMKICGIRRKEDVLSVNELLPDYIGYVFVKSSKRYITPDKASELSRLLDKRIIPVGVFADEEPVLVAKLVKEKTVRAIQLHGKENNAYIKKLRELTDAIIIQAFQVRMESDVEKAMKSEADYILLDSGAGSGEVFDWSMLRKINRPYFLAGGLGADNVEAAIKELKPYGVDASSLLETDGYKDKEKMAAYVKAVRKDENYE